MVVKRNEKGIFWYGEASGEGHDGKKSTAGCLLKQWSKPSATTTSARLDLDENLV